MCVSAFPIIAKAWPCLTLVNVSPTVCPCEVFTTVTSEVISTVHTRSVVLTQTAVTSAAVATCAIGAFAHPVTSSIVQQTSSSIATWAG